MNYEKEAPSRSSFFIPNSRLLKNYFSIVILSEAKNLCAQFEKKNEILRRYAPQNDTTQEFFRSLNS